MQNLIRVVRAPIAFALAIVFWSALAAAQNPGSQSNPFDAAQEFPNLLLPEMYRNQAAAQIPDEVVAQAREKIERALSSVFERMIVPVIPKGESVPKQVRYFPYLKAHLQKIDPQVKILPSGGVVRAALTFIYSELRNGVSLDAIIAAKQDLPAIQVRGIGSDFDVLLDSEGRSLDAVLNAARKLTSSVADSAKDSVENEALKRTMFAVGDIREYSAQTALSVAQGGSSIDYLAYDVGSGRFREPPGLSHIVDSMIRGEFEFLPPKDRA